MNHQNFNFSINSAIKKSWDIFKTNPWFFISLALVLTILNIANDIYKKNPLMIILVYVCALIWSYVWFSISLDGVDGRVEKLNFKSVTLHFPTIKQIFFIALIGLITSITTLLGFILLVIPGIYLMTKFSMANLSFVDRQEGIVRSIKHSWNIVKGNMFWTTLLTIVVSGILILVGALFFGIGLVVTYPLAMFLIAQLYRALDKHYLDLHSISQQAPEITSHTH